MTVKTAHLTAASFAFLRGLAANNGKPWFEAHRANYEQDVKAPIAALITDVAAALTADGLPLEGEAKRSAFRINRDTRFSKDKSPYKTAVAAVWYRQGSDKDGDGVLYFHLGARGCFAAAAFYNPEPEALDAIRERIRVHPDRWQATLAALTAAGLDLEMHDSLTRMPKGFEDMKGSPVADGLRLRSFVVRIGLAESVVTGPALVPAIIGVARAALPILQFGWAAIDEATAGR